MGVRPIPWRGGTLRSRAYQPYRESGRGILLVPGVHAAGIDEPRLVGFARDIAAMGHPVLTVELPDLARYEITARTTDMIEDAAAWMMRRAEYRGRDGRIGMLGISFGGGLAIVASARPAIRNGVAFAMALGGHADLPRTLKYLCTGIQPDGAVRPPHDYGVAIVLLGAADRVVPAGQVQPLRQAILAYLEASRLDMVDKAKALVEFNRAKALEAALPEPSRTYMDYVNTRDVAHLGPVLLPHVAELGGDPALSPARSPSPSAPVYLLHGTDDNVVPAIESTPAGARPGGARRPGARAADAAHHARRGRQGVDDVRGLAADTLLVEVTGRMKDGRQKTEDGKTAPEDHLDRGGRVAPRRRGADHAGPRRGQREDRQDARDEGRPRTRRDQGRRPPHQGAEAEALHPALQAARLRHDAQRPAGPPDRDGSAQGREGSTSIRSAGWTTTRRGCCS